MLLFHMVKDNDELVSGAELAKRIKVSPPYITKKRDTLKSCKRGKKYYFRKSCLALGYDPDNLPIEKSSKNKNISVGTIKETKSIEVEEQPKPVVEVQKEEPKHQPKQPQKQRDINLSDIDSLYNEILNTIADPNTTINKLTLEGLNLKAKALKEFELATAQRLKNKQLEENLYTREEITNIISLATAILRNSLIELPNNFANSLDGLNKKQIKEKSSEIINDILEDFIKVSEQFN